MGIPAEFYHASQRKKPDKATAWEYPNEYVLRKVKPTGYLTFGSQGYFLSESLGEKMVAIRESLLKDCVNVYFRNFRIARINLKERAFVSKKIYRTDPSAAAEIE